MGGVFIAGVTVAYAGTALRLACYRTLGRLFTYEVTVRPKHRLVTNGPYSVVRHPGYVASATTFLGVGLSLMGRDSWFVTSGVARTTGGKVATGAWIIYTTFLLSMFVKRTKMEDALMQKEFGTEWEEWRKRVPYRLVPGII